MTVNTQLTNQGAKLVLTATVWICDNCGNYYAASSAGDLREQWNTEKNSDKKTFRRSRCPTPQCGQDRRPVNVEIELKS